MENQTNETSEKTKLSAKPAAKNPKIKRIILWSSLVVLIAAVGGIVYTITNKNSHSTLVRNYNKDFEAIQTASSAFKTQLETPPNDKKTLQEIITFYRELKQKNNFETQLKELNNNPKYASLTAEKKNVDALGMEKATNDFNDMLKDIDKLQSIIQRSENLDSEIKTLDTTDSPTYDFYEKINELTKKNSTLKDEVLSVVLSAKLKEAQSAFVEALTCRGKYLSETDAAHSAAQSYKWAAERYDDIIDGMNDYRQRARQASYNNSDTLTSSAYKQADYAEKQRKLMDEKLAEQKKHKSEAANMLAKYNGIMGIASTETANTAAVPAQTPRPSVNEERAKIFVEDYLKKGGMALKLSQFSVVEAFLDKSGKSYKEQSEYMDYLKTKGINETLLWYEAKSAETLNDTSFVVTTLEQYDITYGDGSRKIKNFASKYKVVKSGESGFLINELLETKETESIDK